MKPATQERQNGSTEHGSYFTVPGDVLMDILYILLSNNLTHELKSINRNENSVLLYISKINQPAQFTLALENIESILHDYQDYWNGLSGER
jgi:hypothetical protein